MTYKPLILAIEDDKAIRSFYQVALQAQDYKYIDTDSASNGIALAFSHNPDIILLDLGLPDKSGLVVIEEIRMCLSTPIIVVSARSHDHDKIEALDTGADDYLTKPFSVAELSARIRVALRHKNSTLGANTQLLKTFVVGDLCLDYEKHRVYLKNQEVHLTPIEFKLLELLTLHAGKVLTHKFILKTIWGSSLDSNNQSLRVFMANLRRKIEQNPAQPRYITTEVGIGYRLLDE